MSSGILSLLGLALRGGRLAVGEEPAALAAKAGQARLLLTASDAAENTLRRTEHLAQEGHCLRLTLPFSKEELGRALGRGSAAIAALTDTGLAAAVTKRLADLDPERYAEAAARMELKLRRAKERQAAPRQPKKAPSRRDGPEAGRRISAPKDGREDRKVHRPRDHGPDGTNRSRPRSGDQPGRPGGGRPRRPGEDGHRPYGSRSKESRPQGGKPGGDRSRDDRRPQGGKHPGKGRPYKNRGGPRSGGSPNGRGR